MFKNILFFRVEFFREIVSDFILITYKYVNIKKKTTVVFSS